MKKIDGTFVGVDRDRQPGEPLVVGPQPVAAEVTDPSLAETGSLSPPQEVRPAPFGAADSAPTDERRTPGGSSSAVTRQGESGGGRPQRNSHLPEPSTDLYSTALEEFRNGQFEGAFASWQAMMARHADQYTIQVEIDRRLASVEKLFEQYGHWRLYVIVKDGQYWVFSGLFATQAEAERAVGVLPKPLREGGAFPIAVGAFVPVR